MCIATHWPYRKNHHMDSGTEWSVHAWKFWQHLPHLPAMYYKYLWIVILFSKSSQKKSGWREFLQRKYDFNLVLKSTSSRKDKNWHIPCSLYDLLVSHTVIKTITVDKKAEAKNTYWKLSSILINNAPLISKMFVISFKFSIVLLTLCLFLNKY